MGNGTICECLNMGFHDITQDYLQMDNPQDGTFGENESGFSKDYYRHVV